MQGNYEYQSDFARKYYGQGKAEGRQEGLQEGRFEEAREAIIAVLGARGLVLNAEQRQRIESCTDLSQLKAWLLAAVGAHSVAELLD